MNPLDSGMTRVVNSLMQNQVLRSLKLRQEQITLIVIGVLACIAVSYAISRYLFKAKFEGHLKTENKIETIEPENEKPKEKNENPTVSTPGDKISNRPSLPDLESTPKGGGKERASDIEPLNGTGERKRADGATEKGEFKDGKLNGHGSITFPKGFQQIGEFKNGIFSSGVKKWSTTGAEFEGDFKNGLLDGKGTKSWTNGTKWTGTFKEGKLNGQGHKVFPSGLEESGEFENDELHGNGLRIYSDKSIEEGIFEHGIFQDDSDAIVATQEIEED